nr:galactosyldiacylglycerol synthase [Anaerolineae bacterium]
MSENILILTADAGYGHRRAAQAIEAAIQDLYGTLFSVVIANPFEDPDMPQLLKGIEQGYDDMVVHDPGLYRASYKATNVPAVAGLIQDIAATTMHKAIEKLVAAYQPRAVINTYPAFTEAVLKVIQDSGQDLPVAVVVTDLIDVHSLWFYKQASMTFVPTDHVYKQALGHGLSKQHVYLSGLPVHPDFSLKDRDKAAVRRALGWDVELPTALIVGSPRSPDFPVMANLLDQSGLSLQIAVVSGGASDAYKELQDTNWRGAVHTYGRVENMAEMMHAADFILCKAGGLIVSEALACGLPLILYEALPGQEAGNVSYVLENGAGVWAPGPVKALSAVYSWLAGDGHDLETYREAAKWAGHPRAAFEIAEQICQHVLMKQENHEFQTSAAPAW